MPGWMRAHGGRRRGARFSEQAQAAYAATTVDQLGPLFADLPARAHALIGDLRLRSLGPGESAGGWRALLDRLAQRPRPPAS